MYKMLIDIHCHLDHFKDELDKVIDNARKKMNQQVNVIVTSVLQTTAGRMIFAKLKEEVDREELKMARH